MVNLLVTMINAQQQQSATFFLDIGGVFPLLTTTGAIDPAGVMRQAGKISTKSFACCDCLVLIQSIVHAHLFRFHHGDQ